MLRNTFLTLLVLACFIQCNKKEQATANAPEDLSLLVTGTYTGTASRWYSGPNPTCICANQVNTFTTTGNSSVVISRIDNNNVRISVQGGFEPFEFNQVHIKREGERITLTPYLNMKCGSPVPTAGPSHCMDYLGANYISLSGNTISGKLDMSESTPTDHIDCNRSCTGTLNDNSNTWIQLNGAQFQATK